MAVCGSKCDDDEEMWRERNRDTETETECNVPGCTEWQRAPTEARTAPPPPPPLSARRPARFPARPFSLLPSP